MIELGFLAALQAVIGGFDSHTVHQALGCIQQFFLMRTGVEKREGSSPSLLTSSVGGEIGIRASIKKSILLNCAYSSNWN